MKLYTNSARYNRIEEIKRLQEEIKMFKKLEEIEKKIKRIKEERYLDKIKDSKYWRSKDSE